MVDADSIMVEFIALELRERGLVVHVRCHTVVPRLLGRPVLQLRDDTGLQYNLITTRWGGGGTEHSAEIRGIPSLRPAAKQVELEVVGFSADLGPSDILEPGRKSLVAGRWAHSFSVDRSEE